jgi:hypothetical protein
LVQEDDSSNNVGLDDSLGTDLFSFWWWCAWCRRNKWRWRCTIPWGPRWSTRCRRWGCTDSNVHRRGRVSTNSWRECQIYWPGRG